MRVRIWGSLLMAVWCAGCAAQPAALIVASVAPGPISLTAKAAVDIGFYTVKFNAVAGKTYAFQVSKRTEQVVASVLGGMVGMAIDAAANNETSGAFKVTQV